jgi:hypothetical protein
MKTIKLNIKNASAGQMLTLRGELRVMANSWKKFGPVIEVQAGKLQEPKLTSTSAALRSGKKKGGWARKLAS